MLGRVAEMTDVEAAAACNDAPGWERIADATLLACQLLGDTPEDRPIRDYSSGVTLLATLLGRSYFESPWYVGDADYCRKDYDDNAAHCDELAAKLKSKL